MTAKSVFTLLKDRIYTLHRGTIELAHQNPEKRILRYSPGMQELMDSMLHTGRQLCPVHVTQPVDGKYVLVDGHRRYHALGFLGIDVVRAMLCEADPVSAYAHLNAYCRKHSPNEMLLTWLKEPSAVSEKRAKEYENMVASLTRSRVEWLAERGMTAGTYRQAKSICRYIRSNDGFVSKVLDWMVGKRQTYAARRWMDEGRSPDVFYRAVAQGIPLESALTNARV